MKIKQKATGFRHRSILLLCMLFLSVMLVFMLLIRATTQEYTEYMRQNEENQLHLLEQALVSEFYNDKEIVKSLQVYQNIRPFYLQNFPSKASKLIQDLNNHFTNNNIVDEIYMHFFCDKYFYSTKTSYSIRSFLNHFNLSDVKNGEGDRMLQKMQSAKSGEDVCYIRDLCLKPSASQAEKDKVILYVYPYEVDDVVVGSVIFQISERKLNSWIGNTSGRDTYLFNQDGELLNASEINETLKNDVSETTINRQIAQTLRGEVQNISFTGYHIMSGAITDIGLYYLRFVANGTLFSSLHRIQKTYFLALLLLLLFGGTVFAMLSKPLLKLKNAAKGNVDHSNGIVEGFLSSYNDLRKSNQQLKSQAVFDARRNYLLGLLNGNGETEEQLLAQCAEHGISLNAPYHFVLVGKTEDLDVEQKVRRLFASEKHFLYLFSVWDDSSMINWIVGTDSFFTHQQLEQEAAPGMVSIGSVYKGSSHINDSYIEARSYWDVSQNPQQYFRQIQQSIDTCYKEWLQSACEQLEAGKVEEFCTSVQPMYQQMHSQNLPPEIQCRMWLKLILTADRLIQNDLPESEFSRIDPANLVFTEQPDNLFDILNQQIEILVQIKEKKKRPPAPPLTMENVLYFINENYRNDSFSLQMLADYFDISLSYLSLFFKEHYGETLLNYYTNLRMDKAKELLNATNMPLKDIAGTVGYSNISSFIRRFKQLYGVTPGIYREQHFEKESR